MSAFMRRKRYNERQKRISGTPKSASNFGAFIDVKSKIDTGRSKLKIGKPPITP